MPERGARHCVSLPSAKTKGQGHVLRAQADEMSFRGHSALGAGSCSWVAVLLVQQMRTNCNLVRSLLPMTTRPGTHTVAHNKYSLNR